MELLALTHGPNGADPGIFSKAASDAGVRLHERSMLDPTPLPNPESYAGVIVLGGSMHVYEEKEHPWLREEDAYLRQLINRKIPTLGVCLGAQLVAKAAGGTVMPAAEGEIGWTPVQMAETASTDPLMGSLPRAFSAFNWHVDTWIFPEDDGSIGLALSARCPQAFRVGEAAWGVQFHAEVTRSIVRSWVEKSEAMQSARDALLRESDARMDEWNLIGEKLCRNFFHVAAAHRASVG